MAHLHRLSVFLLVLCASVAAHALSCADQTTAFNTAIATHIANMNAAHAGCVAGGSPESVCGANSPGGDIQTQTVSGVTQKRVRLWYTGPASTGSVYVENFGAWTTCTTPEQQTECNAVSDALNFIQAPLVHYGPVALTACYAGYVISGSGGAGGGGQSELYGPFKCSGQSASLCSAVPKPSSIVVTCKEGEYPGTVNGVQVCVPPSSSVTPPTTTTATPPTPGASAPAIPNAPAGTTSQTEQVTCNGTTCTRTTTYTDANGASKGSRTEDVPKPQYCAENPKAPGCETEKSTFAGNCAGGFTYKGDAIQGAIAQEVYRQNCLNNATTTESLLYDSEKVKTGDQTEGLPGNSSVTVSPADFDSSDAIGGAACITDRSVVVWGTTLLLPFSVVCPVMGYLKTILLAVSYLSAASIVLTRRT